MPRRCWNRDKSRPLVAEKSRPSGRLFCCAVTRPHGHARRPLIVDGRLVAPSVGG